MSNPDDKIHEWTRRYGPILGLALAFAAALWAFPKPTIILLIGLAAAVALR